MRITARITALLIVIGVAMATYIGTATTTSPTGNRADDIAWGIWDGLHAA
jgi:hypothetical protein